MKPILEIHGVSKKFRIHHEHPPYLSLRDNITSLFRNKSRGKDEDFWALKNVSFNVEQGESIGIIGRNGAGKSTLLKILSKITPPTAGKIISRGRIASLLEVGTGFHGELSGKENIFLNGSILGMKRREIEKKFDEIVDFSGVEKFIDTPIKHYSSGMQLRLAFSVAAFLDPEILIIDEVLAVGDAEFQKKCLGRMDEVNKSGRTVLFVSHQLGAITRLCNQSVLLKNGAIDKIGETQKIIDYYLRSELSKNETEVSNRGTGTFVVKVQALNDKGDPTSYFVHDEKIAIAIYCQIDKRITNPLLGFYVKDARGRKVFTSNVELAETENNKEQVCYTATLPVKLLVPGQYMFTFAISASKFGNYANVDWVEEALTITIFDGGSKFSTYEGYDYGCVFVNCKWVADNSTILTSW